MTDRWRFFFFYLYSCCVCFIPSRSISLQTARLYECVRSAVCSTHGSDSIGHFDWRSSAGPKTTTDTVMAVRMAGMERQRRHEEGYTVYRRGGQHPWVHVLHYSFRNGGRGWKSPGVLRYVRLPERARGNSHFWKRRNEIQIYSAFVCPRNENVRL